jgi:hypothetical protein
MTEPETNPWRTAVMRLMTALHAKPQTYDELEVASGLDKRAVREWIKAMREHQFVHVAEWKPDALGRSTVAAFAWGWHGVDAPRPAAKTRAQITAAYRARKAV